VEPSDIELSAKLIFSAPPFEVEVAKKSEAKKRTK